VIGCADEPSKVLLVQGAVDYELQPFLDVLEGPPVKADFGMDRGRRIGAKGVVVSGTEVDPINAVAATVLCE
jgi:hypothetical protein